MPMISCDMRYGRTDEQKRALSAGLLRVVSEATGEPPDNIFFVIREGRGINFVEHGKHLPEFVEGNANDKDLIAEVKEATHAVHRMPRRNRSFQAPKNEADSGYREGPSSIDRFGSEDHQRDSGRASRSKHEHFGA